MKVWKIKDHYGCNSVGGQGEGQGLKCWNFQYSTGITWVKLVLPLEYNLCNTVCIQIEILCNLHPDCGGQLNPEALVAVILWFGVT